MTALRLKTRNPTPPIDFFGETVKTKKIESQKTAKQKNSRSGEAASAECFLLLGDSTVGCVESSFLFRRIGSFS